MSAVANPDSETVETSWIHGLHAVLGLTDKHISPRLRTILSCHVKNGKIAFFLPPEMASLQPENLRYMHRLAKKQKCTLIEDRRSVSVQPLLEQRNNETSAMTLGVSMLLNQAGLPGAIPEPSKPYRLDPSSRHIEVAELISMAAFAAPKAKKIVLLPNQFLIDVLGNDTHPIAGHACKLVTADTLIKLAYFEAPNFRAVAYQAEKQFVVHVFLAGGPLHSPQIWTSPHTLSNDSFRFQLFKSAHPGHDFGLMYNTIYLDIN